MNISKPLAASMVGMPTMKQNSVAAGRAKPSSRQSRMVVPERDAPGKIAATTWPSPTAIAIVQVTLSVSVLPRSQASTTTNPMPPINKAQATGESSLGNLKPLFSRMKPRPPVSTKASANFAA